MWLTWAVADHTDSVLPRPQAPTAVDLVHQRAGSRGGARELTPSGAAFNPQQRRLADKRPGVAVGMGP